MTDIERRALLGDREAQKECTMQGIVLSCPCCGEKMEKTGHTFFHKNTRCILNLCSFYETDTYLIALWNTRPAPPIGWCKDCADRHSSEFCECRPDDSFCSDFTLKEG